MKRYLLALAAVGLVVVLGCSRDQGEERVVEGERAPNVSFVDLQGGTWNVSDFAGKVVAVHFWATWCPPCRVEIPELERLYRDLKGRPFQLLPILYDDDMTLGVQFLQMQGATMPLLKDPSRTSVVRFGVTGVPETYLIDKKGVLRKSFVGAVNWDDPEIRKFLDTLMNE